MSLETRSSALFKRAEQIKRWEESETNREPVVANGRERKIKFSAGCVFLAACKAGDKEEILRLLKKGADIDTTDVDGLSALHQACIDDNLDLVEFLVEHGADVNKGDNEGWTPLHATASCGFISIAKYLIENGANVAAVNNDGELPVDVAESDEMEDMLQQQIDDRGIDAEKARTEEERMMMNDAKTWLAIGYIHPDKTHPKTGATPLHVAAAKGYLKVMDLLLKAGADPDAKDLDGWTALHAASHWGQKEACEVLVENLCDMDIKNCVGQTAVDVADNEILRTLEDLRKKQAAIPNKDNIINRRKNNQKKPPPQTQEIISDDSDKIKKELKTEQPNARPKVPEVPQVELEIQPEPAQNQSTVDKKNRVNENRLPIAAEINKTVPITPAPSVPPKAVPEDDDVLPSWRRPGSFRSRIAETPTKTNLSLKLNEKDSPPSPRSAHPPSSAAAAPEKNIRESPQEVRLRRTQSFEADEKFYQRYLELRAKIAGNSLSSFPATPMRSASLKEKHFAKRAQGREDSRFSGQTASTNSLVTNSGPAQASPPQANPVRRSFVPPVRDEESETQRKAHAKRVRETRRSTQGVTLEEIKSAEQLVKKKQQQQLQQATQQLSNSEPSDEVVVNVRTAVPPPPPQTSPPPVTSAPPTATATLTPTKDSRDFKDKDESNGNGYLGERRPSWRLKVDNANKFMLEDARKNAEGISSAETVVRKTAYATPVTETGDTTITLPLRKKTDEKESDNDNRTAQATQAAIQRRRRPKRRSTGVVHLDMDDIDPDRPSDAQGAGDTDDSLSINNSESGGEQSEASSRLNSVSVEDDSSSKHQQPTTANGEIDYKKLWEESQAENAILRDKLRCAETELSEVKRADRGASQARSGMSDSEKREKRAMERKLSEMEEELKQLEQLKCDNQRLKDENGALIRVISKLSK